MSGDPATAARHTSERDFATVIARWATDRALLLTDAGRTLSLPVEAEFRAAVDVGVRAWVEFDASGGVQRWGVGGDATDHSDVSGRWL